jgi:hypothetical protein
MPNTPKVPAFKKGDRAKRTCGNNCARARKCEMFHNIPTRFTAVEVEIDRLNPLVHGCYDVVDKEGTSTTCPRSHLEKIEEKAPYWGTSQNDPVKPKTTDIDDLKRESKTEQRDPVVAGVADFGYGPACSFPKCHAMMGEDHSIRCPKKGPFDPEAIL